MTKPAAHCRRCGRPLIKAEHTNKTPHGLYCGSCYRWWLSLPLVPRFVGRVVVKGR